MKYLFLALFAGFSAVALHLWEMQIVLAIVVSTVLTFAVAVVVFISSPPAFVKEFGRHDPVAKKALLPQGGIPLPDGETND